MHLLGDDFFRALKTGRRRGWEDGSQAQHEVVFDAISNAAAAYAAGGYLVVLDTLIRPQYLSDLVDNIKSGQIDVHYVVLRPTLAVAVERSHGREASQRHDDTVLEFLHSSFEDLGPLESHVVDNSDQGPEVTVEAIRALVRSGRARL